MTVCVCKLKIKFVEIFLIYLLYVQNFITFFYSITDAFGNRTQQSARDLTLQKLRATLRL
jgi:hypothetical protein